MPDNTELYFYLAVIFNKLGNNGDALYYIERASRLKPKNKRYQQLSGFLTSILFSERVNTINDAYAKVLEHNYQIIASIEFLPYPKETIRAALLFLYGFSVLQEDRKWSVLMESTFNTVSDFQGISKDQHQEIGEFGRKARMRHLRSNNNIDLKVLTEMIRFIGKDTSLSPVQRERCQILMDETNSSFEPMGETEMLNFKDKLTESMQTMFMIQPYEKLTLKERENYNKRFKVFAYILYKAVNPVDFVQHNDRIFINAHSFTFKIVITHTNISAYIISFCRRRLQHIF